MIIILNNISNFELKNFTGELAALCAAFLWAVSSVIYSRLGERVPPLQLNIVKGVVAIALLIFTICLRREFLPAINPLPFCLLLLSGVMGIGLGDTAFFAALNCLGARRTLLMETLAPPITAALSLLVLQEQLSAGAWCGILLTILGVVWVIGERLPYSGDRLERTAEGNRSTNFKRGVSLGILAATALAIGAVLARAALANTNISSLWAALLRLVAGVTILLPWAGLGRQQNSFNLNLLSGSAIRAIFLAAFAGTYLGIWLQQTAIKYTAAGIALTLTNTSPLFVLPLAIWLGEEVSLRAIVGVLIALSGVGLLFYLK